jgi:CRISPR-associated protein Cas1
MSDSPDLIPVRALNQATYCPRLYYLQYVDCVMPTNEHVEGGLFDHRRVDDPDLKQKARTEGEAVRTRGVPASSEKFGISGVLDQIEEKHGERYPVETKHGTAPRDADGHPTTWDNDAVQLCAQAMLLEEQSGEPVTRGFQFYAGTRERVAVEFTPELRRKTLDTITLCRDLSASDTPPSPLPAELRHRCFGCSLAPVCLPEETLYQLNAPEKAEEVSSPNLVRVIPGSDDGAVLYVNEPGSYVGKRSEHLTVKKDGKEITKVPMHAVRQVVLFGNVQVSTQALQTLIENEIPVSLLTGYGKFIGGFQPPPKKNVHLREAQFKMFADPTACLTLAKEVVRAKLSNQRALLMRSLRGDGDHGSDERSARDMADLLKRLDKAESVGTVFGLEGQGAALYFGEFGRFLVKQPPGRGFDFNSRNRRPPKDPVNALLSFAYALLAKDCFAAACTVGFDPYKGFFHVNRHGKPSLALDLMEEFRPIIADSVVLTLINNEMLTPADFLVWKDACQLTENGRRIFFQAYEQRKATEVTHPVYGYRMTYSRMIEVQARMLAAFVRGTTPRYTGFTVR